MKKSVIVVCLLASLSARLSAELKYTVHVEAKKMDVPAAPNANPMISMVAEGMLKQMIPEGGADIVYTVGEKGVRIDYLQAAMGQREGTFNIAQPDGTFVVVYPKDKSYWKTNADAAAAMMRSSGAPQVTAKMTGEVATVAGLKCEVMAFDWKMDLPIPESARASLPPNFPTSLAMTGDSCLVKDRFQKYAELAGKMKAVDMLAALGLDKLMLGGIVVRQSLRMSGIELQSVVTKIGEEEVPAGMFDIPADYKEVQAPMGPGIR
jgi:hypothetical protein